MGIVLKNQRGLGLISIILIIVIMGLAGAGLVSMTNTETYSAMGQNAGLRALGVAEGGMEYALRFVTAANFPNYSLPPFSDRVLPIGQCNGDPGICLGGGRFVVDPPTVLLAGITNVTPIIPVVSTAGFYAGAVGAQGGIWIGNELILYTGTTPNSFTGGVLGVIRGAGGPTAPPAAAHAQDDSVYPVTAIDAPGGVNNAVVVIPVFSTVGFVIPGVIRFELDGAGAMEYAYCTGTTPTTFTGCIRGYGGGGAFGHAGVPTPTPIFQYVITATGTVPTPVLGNAQRRIQVTVDQ